MRLLNRTHVTRAFGKIDTGFVAGTPDWNPEHSGAFHAGQAEARGGASHDVHSQMKCR